MRRVVITGIGLLTALGVGTESTWQGLIEGRSAVGPIRAFDASTLRTQLGAEMIDFDPQAFIPNRRTLRMMSRNDRLAMSGTVLAVQDSGLDMAQFDGPRIGVFTGCNKEVADPMYIRESALAAVRADGTIDQHLFGAAAQSAFYPLFYVEGLQAASLFYISQMYGAKGANAFFAGAADSGAAAIGRAYRAVRRGESDVAIAGGFDDSV
jgi:3-oxoacyl-[acyl-carrier-protein] synthase II